MVTDNITKVGITKLLIAFVMLIVGVALVSPMSNEIYTVTQNIPVTNELHSIASLRTNLGNISEAYIDLSNTVYHVSITNLSNGSLHSAIPTTCYNTTGGGYTQSQYGMANTTACISEWYNAEAATGNQTYVSYNYYVLGEGWHRTVVGIVLGFFVLAIFAGAIGFALSSMKDLGITDKI